MQSDTMSMTFMYQFLIVISLKTGNSCSININNVIRHLINTPEHQK